MNATVKRLIGHTNVVYYNCETNAWNRKKYNNYKLDVRSTDARGFKECKAEMEAMPEFSQHYEFIAPVAMTIASPDFPGRARLISNPKYNRNGTAIIGNIIVRNKSTAIYELYGSTWVGVCDCVIPRSAAQNCARWFTEECAMFSSFCKALLVANAR